MTDLIPVVVDGLVKLAEHVGPCIALAVIVLGFQGFLHYHNIRRFGKIERALKPEE